MVDPISDMMTRIRNAQRAGHREVIVPASKLKESIAELLAKNNFVKGVQKKSDGKFSNLRISVKYEEASRTEKNPTIVGIRRVSTQGQRIYLKKGEIRKVKNGYGVMILSTSRGVMTGEDARKLGVGGEVICEVW